MRSWSQTPRLKEPQADRLTGLGNRAVTPVRILVTDNPGRSRERFEVRLPSASLRICIAAEAIDWSAPCGSQDTAFAWSRRFHKRSENPPISSAATNMVGRVGERIEGSPRRFNLAIPFDRTRSSCADLIPLKPRHRPWQKTTPCGYWS
jgi:hypothetical protein